MEVSRRQRRRIKGDNFEWEKIAATTTTTTKTTTSRSKFKFDFESPTGRHGVGVCVCMRVRVCVWLATSVTSKKLPKHDFNRKIKAFDTFTKIA